MLFEFQLTVLQSSIVSFFISLTLCFTFIKVNTNFIQKENKQKRLSSLNIIPLGGVAMATSFFIAVRLLGEAGEKFTYISLFALAIAFLGVLDDFLNLNWKIKILFQLIFVSVPIYYLKLFINFENIIDINLNNNLNFIFTTIWIILLMNS